ncbi:MAG: MASE1 domain-containing protein [Magnetospirillum sp.]|nr:MASE1 domain-containing protein [Magnetospirillum sp.]
MRRIAHTPHWVTPWLYAVLLGVAYHSGAKLGLLFTVAESGISVFWIPNAVTLAALLLAPKAWWPHFVIASLMGDYTAEIASSSVQDSIVFAAINAAQTLSCAAILRRASINPISHPHHYLAFLLIYVGIAASLGAAIATLYTTSAPTPNEVWAIFLSWWLGDSLYVMTLTPLILRAFRASDHPVRGGRNEAIVLGIALFPTAYFDFYLRLPTGHLFLNTTLPLLLWAAFRFGIGGAGTAISILTAIASISAINSGGGSLPNVAITEHVLYMQLMLLGNATSAMLLAIVGEGWTRAEKAHALALHDSQSAQDKAEQANAAKSHFLAAASHDLRQPFQALRLFIDILDQGITKPTLRKVVEAANTALSGGETLLTALLDLSRLDAGAVKVEAKIFPLSPLLTQLGEECAEAARQKNIALIVVGSSLTADSDPVLLSRLLRNLLHNAVKYTEQGRILLGCRRGKDFVRIEVWDTGIGIPPEQQSRIFDDFYQIGNTGRDHAKGLGIGLAVVRRTARHLGHQISMRSVPGRGSVFAVTIPHHHPAALPPEC